MSRAISLSKMVLLMIGACISLSIAEHLAYEAWPIYGPTPASYLERIIWHAVEEGFYWGVSVGIAMALVTAVFFRRIRNPLLYLLAMVIVASVVTIATQPISLPRFIQMTERLHNGGIWLFAYLARTVLMIIAGLMVARMYAAQAARRKLKKTDADS